MPPANRSKRAVKIASTESRVTARQFNAGRPFDSSRSQFQANVASPLPTLRSALRLYLLVVLATTAIVVGLVTAVDVTFLRFLTAIIVFNGFTFLALILTHTRLGSLVGRSLSPPTLAIGLLAGITLWTPGTWLLLVISQTLGVAFGNLPAPIGSNVSLIGKAIIFGLIIPLSEGWLFFGFILSAARGIGNWRGMWLTALLFGLFGMFADQFGMSAIPAYLLLGLVAGALVMWSESMWPGILVLSAFELAEPLGLGKLLTLFLKDQSQDLWSFSWLTAVVVFAFLTFVLTRIARSIRSSQNAIVPAYPGNAWWLALLVVIVLTVLIGRAEIQTRLLNPVSFAQTPLNSSAQTVPPIAPLPTPTATLSPGFFVSPTP